jgi:quinol-cytochrome oxidoreductase complex cytochrome b subunit
MYIQNTAAPGGVVRGIDSRTAYLVAITATLHSIRVFVTASYKVPRELNWPVGLGLLLLLLFGGVFRGTVLRWDEESYAALAHNMELAQLLGAAGGCFKEESHANGT